MATYTVITLPNGQEIGRVECRKIMLNGQEVLEKTYIMNDAAMETPPAELESPGRASQWTKEQAEAIASQHTSRGGKMTTRALAGVHKVSLGTINNILSGKTKKFKR